MVLKASRVRPGRRDLRAIRVIRDHRVLKVKKGKKALTGKALRVKNWTKGIGTAKKAVWNSLWAAKGHSYATVKKARLGLLAVRCRKGRRRRGSGVMDGLD